jgi:hypothetical protein
MSDSGSMNRDLRKGRTIRTGRTNRMGRMKKEIANRDSIAK